MRRVCPGFPSNQGLSTRVVFPLLSLLFCYFAILDSQTRTNNSRRVCQVRTLDFSKRGERCKYGNPLQLRKQNSFDSLGQTRNVQTRNRTETNTKYPNKILLLGICLFIQTQKLNKNLQENHFLKHIFRIFFISTTQLYLDHPVIV